MSDSIDQQVCQIAADVFGVPLAKITRESSPQTLENWDSVQHLNFVLAMEQGLNLQFEPEDIEQIQNVGAAIELVKQKLKS
jgi:acyl carrier protein